MKQIAISIVLSIALLSLHSCKEGCRDPKAMNYDSKATNDNASCLFCNDTTTLQYDLITVKDLINNSSPYYKHDIIQARVYSTTHTIAGNGCGAIGKTNVKTNITNITLVNLTSKLITISFSIFHYGTNHITYDFYFSGYNILPSSSYVHINPNDSVSTYTPITQFPLADFGTGNWVENINDIQYQ